MYVTTQVTRAFFRLCLKHLTKTLCANIICELRFDVKGSRDKKKEQNRIFEIFHTNYHEALPRSRQLIISVQF